MQVSCLCGPRKSKPGLKSELGNQQYNVTLLDSNHLAHVIVLWQMPKTLCVWNDFLCLILNMGQFPSTSPRGACIWRGDLSEGYLRYEFGGLIFGGGYFRYFAVTYK